MWRRLKLLFKTKLSKVLDRAENPSDVLDYGYQQQLELLQNVKRGIADIVTQKKRLEMSRDKFQEQVLKFEDQAREALKVGREDLAALALERKQLIKTQLDNLDRDIDEMAREQERLVESEKKLRTKVESFRVKKEVVKAQYSAAEARVQISEAATGVGNSMADVGMAMQRVLDKTEDMKARANAVEELEQAGTFEDLISMGSKEDDIDRQLREINSPDIIKSDLERLKSELGMAPSAPALDSAPASETLDDLGDVADVEQVRVQTSQGS